MLINLRTNFSHYSGKTLESDPSEEIQAIWPGVITVLPDDLVLSRAKRLMYSVVVAYLRLIVLWNLFIFPGMTLVYAHDRTVQSSTPNATLCVWPHVTALASGRQICKRIRESVTCLPV